MRKRRLREQLDRLVVQDMKMIPISACHSAMAVAHVFAKTYVCDHHQIGRSGFDRTHRLLHDPFIGIGRTSLIIFVLRNAEEQHRLEPEIARELRFRGDLGKRELRNAGHAGDCAVATQFLAYEERQDEIVCRQLCLTNQIAQSRSATQPARTMEQIAHSASVGGAAKCRKLDAIEPIV